MRAGRAREWQGLSWELCVRNSLKENVFGSLWDILQYFKVKTTDKVRNQSPQIKVHFYFTLSNSGEMTGAEFFVLQHIFIITKDFPRTH